MKLRTLLWKALIEFLRLFEPGNWKTIWTILQFEIRDYFRNKWLLIYSLSFFILVSLILYTGGNRPLQAFASLLNLILLIIPLFTMIFAGFSISESIPFYEILLSRDIRRGQLFLGKWAGIGLGLSLAFLLGAGIPALIFLRSDDANPFALVFLFCSAIPLHFIFAGIAFLVSLLAKRREVMLAGLLSLWFYFYIVYDLILMTGGVYFGEYPLELPLFVMVILNPVDLIRITLILQLEITSIMGLGAAFFQNLLGGSGGVFFSLTILIVWSILPGYLGLKIFRRKDF